MIDHPTTLRALPIDALPVYPIGPQDRLDGNAFVKWQRKLWMASRTYKLMSWDMQGMARALFDMCQDESPVGTLPDDDAELAYMLRCDIIRMRDLRAMEFGPLRNWRRCLCGNVVRLMHDTVLEQVQDAMERQELARLSKDERAAAQRLQRLRKALADEKLSKEVIADDTLIARMDEWLTTTRQGRRTPAVYRSAILHAVQMGWLNRRTMR